MTTIPHDSRFDSSLAFAAEGYAFVGNRCRRYGSDIFEARLLGRRTFCVLGEDAARMFYEPNRFTRRGALPKSALHLLQDEGSVATLDGAEHRRRKAMFLSMMSPENLESVASTARDELLRRARSWEGRIEVRLHPEFRHILCRTACVWAGVPLSEDELDELAHDLGAMVDNAGRVGPPNWAARLTRRRVERRLEALIDTVRAGYLPVSGGSPLHVIAFHEDADGVQLSSAVAAAELLNILRPIVAVARFMTFAALALHDHPEARARLQGGEEGEVEAFVQEVRRFYPFFPAVAGLSLVAFSWRGFEFRTGDCFLLDLYGTDHDARIWEEPGVFRPERFENREIGAFSLVPQGGGDHAAGHRCAGEWMTIAVMKAMVGALACDMRYRVPPQDLSYPFDRLPALPRSGMIVTDVSVREPA
jgi:fatty-acid peroxygenase